MLLTRIERVILSLHTSDTPYHWAKEASFVMLWEHKWFATCSNIGFMMSNPRSFLGFAARRLATHGPWEHQISSYLLVLESTLNQQIRCFGVTVLRTKVWSRPPLIFRESA